MKASKHRLWILRKTLLAHLKNGHMTQKLLVTKSRQMKHDLNCFDLMEINSTNNTGSSQQALENLALLTLWFKPNDILSREPSHHITHDLLTELSHRDWLLFFMWEILVICFVIIESTNNMLMINQLKEMCQVVSF